MPFSSGNRGHGRSRLGSSGVPFSIDDAFDIPEEEQEQDQDQEHQQELEQQEGTPIVKSGPFRLQISSESEEARIKNGSNGRDFHSIPIIFIFKNNLFYI